MRPAFGSIVRFLTTRARGAFVVAFVALAARAGIDAYRNPLGPGLDQHYHVLNAWIAARGWFGDPAIRALYAQVNPLDANTLVYTWTAPFHLFLDPVRAYGAAFALLYFVGYPAACAMALHLFRRPLWGALLAFPMCFVNAWVKGGYVPFVSVAPFFVLAIGAMHRFLESVSSRPGHPSTRAGTLVLATTLGAAFAHAQGYLWTMTVLGLLTLVALGRDAGRALVVPREALRAGVAKGTWALAAVLPSLLLFIRWIWPSLRGGGGAPVPPPPEFTPWKSKLDFFSTALVSAKDDTEWAWAIGAFALVATVTALSGRPRSRELRSPEIAFVVTFVSFFLLPEQINGQSIGLRQADFACWLLPLVAYPSEARAGARLRGFVAVAGIAAFASLRLAHLAPFRASLSAEYAGITRLGCPAARPGEPLSELAFVTFAEYSQAWHSPSLRQAHESYAALCGLDTPVYEPGRYAFSLPVHYRVPLPAPITIHRNYARWYAHPKLFQDFEYVLVHAWQPTPSERAEAKLLADEVRTQGPWSLWRRRTSAPDFVGR